MRKTAHLAIRLQPSAKILTLVLLCLCLDGDRNKASGGNLRRRCEKTLDVTSLAEVAPPSVTSQGADFE